MDTIRHLIGYFLRFAVGFFLIAFVWWVMTLLVPGLSISNLFSPLQGKSVSKDGKSSKVGTDILPAPKNYQGLLAGKKTLNDYNNVYVAGEPFNGYGASGQTYTYSTANYVTYTSTGVSTTNSSGKVVGVTQGVPVTTTGVQQTTNPSQLQTAQQVQTQTQTAMQIERSKYIRNLSIYEGGHVYTGLSFVGEARSEYFKEGRFPIVVVDQRGAVIGVSAAVATTKWSVPGWVRWETKIPYALPNNVPCTMVFEEALTQEERATKKPVRMPFNVRCN